MRPVDAEVILCELEGLLKDPNKIDCMDFMAIGYNHAIADAVTIVKNAKVVDDNNCRWFETCLMAVMEEK